MKLKAKKTQIIQSIQLIISQKNFQKKKIFFLIGSDIINEFPFWKKSDEILKKITLICLKRPGQKYSIPSNYKKNIKFFKYNTTIKMSSDMVRNLQKLDLPEKVLEYITKKRLYFIKKVKKYYTAKRLKHALNVALLAMKIAKKNKIKNYKKCYIAGLLHDITKKMPLKQQREIIYKIDKKNINIHKKLYHQLTGAYIVKKDFNINDKVIIDAIKFHTTGKKNFSPVGKILFIADKLDPSRNIKNLKIMLNNSYKNYNNIYLSLLKKISKLNF
ncbi:MAG: bis(5'-nucleosyl)-tetraphosphatase (symmetrical) YqeK [Bacilli bacterium]|nr:bis(5'-nucleosyl)-tetraphosphatase (symmetrical) YqeK [Bacilli bacterium]